MDVSRSFCFIFHTLSWTVLKAEGDWKSVRSPGTLNFYFFLLSQKITHGILPSRYLKEPKSVELWSCCSFLSHKDLQLHNFMVAATKTAFSPLIPEQPFLICKGGIQKGVSSHLSLHQESVKRLLLMHLESGRDPLLPCCVAILEVFVVVKPNYEHFIIINY